MKNSIHLVLLILCAGLLGLAPARSLGQAAQTPSASTASLRAPRPASNEAGRPFIRNFSPKEYGAHPQNWAIVQDQRGVMYFANGLGVLEYDAVSWRLIEMPNKSVVRSLDVDENGRIYVGAQGDFGYLAGDSLGRLRFVSLLGRLPPEDREFTDVWRTFVTKQGIYFQTSSRLFRCVHTPAGWSVKIWKPSTRFHRASLLDDQIYLPQPKIGLMQLEGDSLRLLAGTERFAEEVYPVLLPYSKVAEQAPEQTAPSDDHGNKNILIATSVNGLFLYDGLAVKPFETKADDFLRASEIYRGTLLPDGSFALATRLGGVIIIDHEGHASIIDKDSGLRVNKIYFVYADRQNVLWLGMENGISRVETPAPFSFYGESAGIKSTVYDILKHQGRLYVSTNAGVFCLEVPGLIASSAKPKFLPVRGITEQSWALLAMDDQLLVATGDGVFRIKNDNAEPIKESVSESFLSVELYRSRQNKNRVYVGLNDGLAALRYESASARWIDEGRIPGIYELIWSIVEDEQGVLWLGTDAQGVIRLSIIDRSSPAVSSTEGPSEINHSETMRYHAKAERFSVANGLAEGGIQVFLVDGKEFFAATTGIFRFDKQRNLFVHDSTFAVVAFGNTQEEYNLKEDGDGNVWINFGKESAVARRQPNGAYVVERTPFLRFAEAAIAIYPEASEQTRASPGQTSKNGGIVWFGGPDGLVRYDGNIKKDYTQDYAALIRRVISGGDSIIFEGSSADLHLGGGQGELQLTLHALPRTLSYVDNALRFEFSAPFYEAETENQFQTYLQGFDQNWSAWSTEAKKDYTNLPKGDYRFRVRAKNVYNHESAEASFDFTILPPWYRTWWAYFLYAAALGAVISGLVLVRTQQLHARSRALEKMVHDRTQEIRQQAVAIQSQADELEEKNREIMRTQERLIVQEKLASLGQLTAGIAHEIKNPLNFVNNFAKLSVDLIMELRQGFEDQKEKLEPAAQDDLQELMRLLSQNIAKIDEHGRRADSIVKGMLLHSRGESGERRPADLNDILDEYVMLAYHGMRGTDSSFNVKIEKDYDPAVGRVEVFPQDISRVFLNLVNNACYATHQKKKQLGESYAPVLSVSTKNLGNKVEIRIRDNGTGIPSSVLSKVFHPFFTTKPAGQGTGLGLSLSYDIVVHEHNGEIKIETTEGEFTEFMVRLPKAA